MFIKNVIRFVRAIPFARGVSSQAQFVDLSVTDDGIAVLTMQRPPVNALNLQMLEATIKALDEISNSKYKGMILTSAMPTIFSGGLDIMEMYKPDLRRAEIFWKGVQDIWLKLFTADYVTASAINGHAPGGGCLLALACEYRAMVRNNCTIGLNEAALGILAYPWTMDTLVHVIPMRQAELALTSATLFTPDEALEVGIIDDVAKDKQDAIDKCKVFIRKFDNIPQLARSKTKQLLRERIVTKFLDNRQEDTDLFMSVIKNPTVQQNLESYIQQLKQKKRS